MARKLQSIFFLNMINFLVFHLERMIITMIKYDQNQIKLLYFNSFVAIKIYWITIVLIGVEDVFYTTPFTDNFHSRYMVSHGYELFRTSSCSLELVAGGLGGCG